MNPEQDFVMKTIKSRDVHFVRLWFTDVLGTMKSFAVSPSEIEGAFQEGMGFDGSCVAGFSPTEENQRKLPSISHPFFSAFSLVIITTQAAPSVRGEEFPAVETPSFRKEPGNAARLCVVQSSR